MTKIKVIALDLEGTLISNAMSQFPRPGLYAFLEACRERVERVVMFTSVKESGFRPIAVLLVEEGHAPPWFRNIEFITWEGATKNLDWIPGVQPDEALLVDDFKIYVHPGQEAQWVRAPFFDWPYPDTDRGLMTVLLDLEGKWNTDCR